MAYRFLWLMLLATVFALPLSAQCPQLVWEDAFDGDALDLTKWTHQIGDGCDINLCGWGNNELQYYRPENTEVSNGTLKITAQRESFENRNYTSSRINTKGLSEWTYGRFEARMKLPTGKGLWPAFWMLSTDEPYGSWPQSGEIDIMEIIGSEPSISHGTIHFGQLPNNRSATESYALNASTFNDDFHTFAIEWESSVIRWYVDDYLFSTKIRSVTGGSRWPFDHDFHFLLNVAVGGNWPGSPNASTVFPQTMEVDYVRVYDGYFPSINGPQVVENQAQGTTYRMHQLATGTEVQWSIPDGATLQNQGGQEVTIDWADQGGIVLAVFDNGCGPDTIQIDVLVKPPFVSEFSLENFDEEAKIAFNFATGTLTDAVANPSKNEVNNSDLCGQYDRNGGELFDVLFYDTDAFENVTDYLTGEKEFYLDVLTDAPVNTLILIQLENDARSQDNNFPTGRNSRFEARTSAQGEWHRLKFKFLDQPDPNTSALTIDRIVLLFASNTNLNSRFYFDNFDSYAPQQSVSVKGSSQVESIRIFPNPSTDFLRLEGSDQTFSGMLHIFDASGQLILEGNFDHKQNHHDVDVSKFSSGLYLLKWTDQDGWQKMIKFLKS